MCANASCLNVERGCVYQRIFIVLRHVTFLLIQMKICLSLYMNVNTYIYIYVYRLHIYVFYFFTVKHFLISGFEKCCTHILYI